MKLLDAGGKHAFNDDKCNLDYMNFCLSGSLSDTLQMRLHDTRTPSASFLRCPGPSGAKHPHRRPEQLSVGPGKAGCPSRLHGGRPQSYLGSFDIRRLYVLLGTRTLNSIFQGVNEMRLHFPRKLLLGKRGERLGGSLDDRRRRGRTCLGKGCRGNRGRVGTVCHQTAPAGICIKSLSN